MSKKSRSENVRRPRRIEERGLAATLPEIRGRWPEIVGLVLVVLLVGHLPGALAQGIPTGPNPVDTVTLADGSAAYVLNSGNSTVTVVDPKANLSTGTLTLPIPPNTCMDMDWSVSLQQLVVGCNNGQVWTVDPATGVATLSLSNPAANYSQITADNLLGGALYAWGYDRNRAWLDQFLVGGVFAPATAIPFATATELIEVRPSGNPATRYLMLLGRTGPGFVGVSFFDRTAMTPASFPTWGPPPAVPTGITSLDNEAYVSATDAVTGMAYLLQLPYTGAFFTFTAPPVWTGPAVGASDVTSAGQFLTVFCPGLTGGTDAYYFDAADPANVLQVGWINIEPNMPPAGGGSSWIDPAGSFEDLYVLVANTGSSAAGESGRSILDNVLWNPGASPTITGTGTGLVQTSSSAVQPTTPSGCGACMDEEFLGRGWIDAWPDPDVRKDFPATACSVEFATAEEVYSLPLFKIPGVGMDLGVNLTYRSRIGYDYRYGRGWTLDQDVRLRTEPNGDETYLNGHGRADTFASAGGGSFVPPVRYDSTLNVQGTTATLTSRFGTASTFQNGYRTQVQDRYGNALTYSWTGDQLTSITDTLNRSYTLSYGTDGRLSSITDFGGRTWTLTYDYMGQLKRVTTPASTQFPQGRSVWFSYTGNSTNSALASNLVHVWSPLGDGVQTLYYDGYDRVVKETIGDGSYAMSYASLMGSDTKTTVVDRSGNTTEWTFSTFGVPIKEEVFTKGLRQGEPNSYVTTMGVDQTTGLVTHVSAPAGNRTDYQYDSALNLVEVRRKETDTPNQSGTDIVYSYQYGGPFNQRSQYTDPRGNITVYQVDAQGNTTQIQRPTVTSPSTQTITETFSFDGRGRITNATDGAGRTVDFVYYTTGSHAGYLQSVTKDQAGLALTTTLDYSQYGDIVSVTDARGATTAISVDAEGYVTEVQAPSPLSYRRRLTYDAGRRVTLVEVENVDRHGTQDPTTPWIETSFTYDVVGRPLAKTVDLTSTTTATTTYAYDGSGDLVSVTRPEGGVTALEWDERRLIHKVRAGAGSAVEGTFEYAYDLNGSLATSKNPRSYETTFEHDHFDRRTRVTDALGAYRAFQYDKSGNQTLVEAYDSQAALLARTARYFDEVDRLWKTVDDRFGPNLTPSQPTTIVTRDPSGLVTQVTDPLSNSTSYSFDAAARLVQILDATGNHDDFSLDANGNITTRSHTDLPAGGGSETFVTEFDYDAINRVTQRREIDRSNGQNVLTTNLGYDSRNDLTWRLDAESHPVRWTYDLASRLLTYERALQTGQTIEDFTQSITESFQYDGNDRLTGLTDDNFDSTSYQFDARDRQTRVTYADTRYVDTQYDPASNVSQWTDQNGTVVQNTFDALGRKTYASVTRGTGVLGSTFEQFTYDALGRMLTAVDDDFQDDLTWDSVGNLLKERQGYNAQGQEKWKSVTTTWSDASSVQSVLYPSAFAAAHTRDAIYRMTALQDVGAGTNIATFTYQGAGRLATTSNQNGTSTEYAWDGFARIQDIDHKLGSGQTLHKFTYAYDRAHNRRMEQNTFDATWVGTLPQAVQTFLTARNTKGDVYAYDWAYRLTDVRYDTTSPLQEVQNPGSQTFAKNTQYVMDGLGNRSQVLTTPPTPPSTVTYASDVVNQYTQVGGVTRTHDNNGNLTDDGTYLFAYDFENRLVEVKLKATQAVVATYRYDALGRRVEKAVSGGATTRYVLDGQQVIEEYDGSDVWQARYVYEDGIDHPRVMDRADQADVNGNQNTTEVLRFTYHQQALGSVTELSEPGGSVVEWVTYDVYGKPRILDQQGNVVGQSPVGNPYLFTGREYDAEDGLYFHRARTYDPSCGRFIQRDPIGYRDVPSLYLYVHARPASGRDPTGRDELDDALAKAERDEAEATKTRDDAEKRIEELQNEVHQVLTMYPEQLQERQRRQNGSIFGPPGGEATANLSPEGFRDAEIDRLNGEIDKLKDEWNQADVAAHEARKRKEKLKGKVAERDAAAAAAHAPGQPPTPSPEYPEPLPDGWFWRHFGPGERLLRSLIGVPNPDGPVPWRWDWCEQNPYEGPMLRGKNWDPDKPGRPPYAPPGSGPDG